MITFPSADGSASALTNFLSGVRFFHVTPVVRRPLVNVTGILTGGAPDKLKRIDNGFPILEYHWGGVVEVGGVQAASESSSLTHGTIKMHSGRWSIARTWELEDMTGSSSSGTADTEKRWKSGSGTIFGSAEGQAIATGPLYTTPTETLTIKNNLMTGTAGITGTAHIKELRTVIPYNTGGKMSVRMTYEYAENYAHAEDNDGANFSSTLGENITEAPRVTGMVIVLDTGETISSFAAFLSYISISTRLESGGPIYIQGIYRRDHA